METGLEHGEPCGSANGSQPFSSGDQSNVIGGWLRSLTFVLGHMTPQALAKLYETSVCPVCGFQLDFEPWSHDGDCPSFEICPCCGVQFGYTDCAPDVGVAGRVEIYSRLRQAWIDSGMMWWSRRGEPVGRNPTVQFERIQNVA